MHVVTPPLAKTTEDFLPVCLGVRLWRLLGLGAEPRIFGHWGKHYSGRAQALARDG